MIHKRCGSGIIIIKLFFIILGFNAQSKKWEKFYSISQAHKHVKILPLFKGEPAISWCEEIDVLNFTTLIVNFLFYVHVCLLVIEDTFCFCNSFCQEIWSFNRILISNLDTSDKSSINPKNPQITNFLKILKNTCKSCSAGTTLKW